jgi:hypothetical protein
MKEVFINTKLTLRAMQLLRLISLRTREKQYGVTERLLETEAQRLGIKEDKDDVQSK